MNYDEYDKLCELLDMEPQVYSYQSYNVAKGGSGKGMFGQAYSPLNPHKILELLKLLCVNINRSPDSKGGKWILFSDNYFGQHEDFNEALILLLLQVKDSYKEIKEILNGK